MAFLVAWCVAVPSLAQDSAATTPDSGFDEVEADLEGQLFTKTLPFDVPFIIFGNVPTGAKSLTIRCWKLDSSGKEDEKNRKSGEPVVPDVKELKEKAPEGNCWKGGPLIWRNTIDPKVENPTFRVLAPRLEAESYYTFEFLYQKEVTKEEADAFAQKVQQVVSRVLWGDPRNNPRISSPSELPLSGSLFAPEEFKAIYDELLAAFKEITGADRIVEPGTIFSEGTDFSAVLKEFNSVLRPVREDQRKIVKAIGDYSDDVANANSPLAKVRSDRTLAKLGQALESRAVTDPSVQHHVQTVSAALAVPDLPDLKPADRKSHETLASFVAKSASAVADASAKLAALADLLANKLTAADGSPAPFVQPLLDSAAFTMADLNALRSPADVQGSVSTAASFAGVASSDLDRLQRVLDERTDAVAGIADDYRTQVVGKVVVAASTTGSFATQHKNYVSADMGLAYTPELDEFPTYAGTNIYFRPVNKAAPLNQFGGFFDTLSRRVSVTIGLTVQGVGDDGKTRKDLFNQQSLVLGIGARLTNSVRLTAGSLVFLEIDPNPLVDDDSVAVTPFLSLSFDIDVVPTLQGIGGLFNPGKG